MDLMGRAVGNFWRVDPFTDRGPSSGNLRAAEGPTDLDELTLERAQRGDREAFRALVERYERPVFALLGRMRLAVRIDDETGIAHRARLLRCGRRRRDPSQLALKN